MSSDDKPAYDHDTHHLLSIKRLPESLIALQRELALPEHRDIYEAASQEATFELAIGQIAAKLSILLDGDYDHDKLFTLLTRALRARSSNREIHTLDPSLVPVEINETKDGSLSIDPAFMQTPEPGQVTGKEREVAEHAIFMKQYGCLMCNDRAACIREDTCLADEGGGMKKKEKGKMQ